MKVEVALTDSIEMVSPGILTVVSCQEKEGSKPNLITIAWAMPLSKRPPMLAVAASQKSLSQELLLTSREMVVNILPRERLPEALTIGSCSGRDRDKFGASGLTPQASRQVLPPAIQQAVGWLECRIVDTWEVGDHVLFAAEIVEAQTESELFDGTWRITAEESSRPVVYWGSSYFVVPDGRREAGEFTARDS